MSTAPIAVAAPTPPVTRPVPARWPPVVWSLLLTTFAARAGGFVYPFLSYRLDGLGLTSSAASTVLAAFGAGWLVGQVLCGWLADRLGRRATLVGAMLLAAAAFPVLGHLQTPVALTAAAAVSGAVYDAPRPVVAAVVADVIPGEAGRAKATGWRHFATNAGAATTGAVGGALAGRTGIPFLFWTNGAVCALIAVLILWVLPRTPRTAASEAGQFREARTDPRLWVLWLASLLILIPVGALVSALPLMMASDGLDAAAYGWTQVTSAVAVLVLSPLLNPLLARRAARPHAMVGALALSGMVLGAGLGSAGLASTALGYSAAVLFAVPGEIIAFVAASDILNRISPPRARATYAGIWGTALAAAIMCAPALAGWSLTHGGTELGALTTLASGFLGAAACLPLHRLLRHSRAQMADLP
ncbi:MFS transporter [Streptomyces sp. NPDC001185]|uniref:MFS transporter n=1 Tax=Streptomyces sp. NPDC001185 TaxID=3154380 RepID=UPI00332C4720